MKTSRPQPLFYQSSKRVAMYLEAKIRVQLFLRCPSFRTVHQTATLRIHDLKICEQDFEINGTVFSVGIIQRCTYTSTPESVKVLNARGGIKHDVDRYGLREEVIRPDSTNVEELEKELLLMMGRRQRWGVMPKLDLAIEEQQLEILRYSLRMNNQEPTFTQDLQLTMTTGFEKKVEHVVYDKNLKFTRDYILGRIFEEAQRKVQIKNLNIGPNSFDLHLNFYFRIVAEDPRQDTPRKTGPYNAFQMSRCEEQMEPLLPVPEGKLEVREIRVTGNLKNALASIKTSLSKSNPPLKKLTCAYQPFPDDPVLHKAEFLCVAGVGTLKVFNGRLNNRIHLTECDEVRTDFMDLVNICTKAGQFYSIGFNHQTPIEEFFEMFRNLPGAESGESDESRWTQLPECIIIPMREETELNVWIEETNEEDKVYCNTQFIVKIKVQRRGHAQVN